MEPPRKQRPEPNRRVGRLAPAAPPTPGARRRRLALRIIGWGAVGTLVNTLKGDPAAEVRAAAATALVGQKDPAVAEALYNAAITVADGAVRVVSLVSLRIVVSVNVV